MSSRSQSNAPGVEGSDYEVNLLTLLSLKALFSDKIADFIIESNNAQYGKFDDIILTLTSVEGKEIKIAFQLKHKINVKGIKREQLENLQGDFSIHKYFESYQREIKLKDKQSCYYVLFTNNQIDLNSFNSQGSELSIVQDTSDISFNTLINICGSDKIHKFQNNNDVSQNEFLERFYLFSSQNNEREVENEIEEIFTQNFGSNKTAKLSKLFKNLHKGRFTNKKLDKATLICHLIDLIILPYHCNNLEQANKSQNSCCEIFYNAVKLFDATHISCESSDFLKQNLKHINYVSEEDPYRWAKDHKFIERELSKTDLGMDSHCRILYHIDNQPIILNYSPDSAKAINCLTKLCIKKFPQIKIILAGSKTAFDLYKKDPELNSSNLFENLSTLQMKDKTMYEQLINQFEVKVNGLKLTSLSEFVSFNDQIASNITTDVIVNSLSTGVIEFGGKGTDELPPQYIPRQIAGDVISIKTIVQDKNTLFIISCSQQLDKIEDFFKTENLIAVDCDKIENKTDINTNIILTVSESDITENVLNKKIAHKPQKTCYLEAIIENENFFGNFRCRKHKKNDSKKIIVEENEIQKYFQKPIEVFSATPGMGKTTLMKSIAKKCSSEYFCILIPLKDYSDFFQEDHSIVDLLNEYFNKRNVSANFQTHLTSYILQKCKVIFLFDGFDEIDRKCHDNFFNCVDEAQKNGYRAWISTRPNFSELLRNRFNINDLEIVELNEQTQKEYIKERLSQSNKINEIDKMITKIYENIIIERHQTLLGTPLLLHMITEMVVNNEEDLLNINNITDLFKYFFKGKYKHCLNKRGFSEFPQEYFNLKLDSYEIPALKLCLETDLFNKLNLYINAKQVKSIRKSGDDLGIIVNVFQDKDYINFSFFHNTYAEYFAAKWLAANYTRIPIEDRNFLLDGKYENLKFMFDIFMAKGCPAHIALLCGDEKRLANCTEDEIFKTDKLNRSVWHIICASGDKFPSTEFSDSDYIPRQILGDVLSFSNIVQDKNTLFIISCSQQLDKIQDFFKTENVIAVDFDKIENKTDINSNIILTASESDVTEDELNEKIKHEFQKTCYLEVIVQNGCFLGYFRYRKQKKNDLKKIIVEENEIQKYFQKSIEVFSATPGMGKTTLMESIVKKCSPDYVYILIQLKVYSDFFEEKHSSVELLNQYFNKKKFPANFEALLIRYIFQKCKVIFLFDGFDEIDRKCHDNFFNCVDEVQKNGHKVWISTRPNFSQLLKDRFNVNDLEIVELNENTQKKYIKNRLSQSNKIKEVDEIFTKIYDNIIIKKNPTILGTPLILHMITEMVIHNKEYLLNDSNITGLFKYFFKGKFIHHINKQGLSTFVEDYFNTKLDSYEIPALKLCLGTDLFNKLHLYINAKQVETIRKSGDGLGIIVDVSGYGDNLNFNFFHDTYAEYFAAKWLESNYTRIPIDDRQFLLEDKYENLKFMFDIFMAEGCPAHIAVTCGDEKRLAKCTENEIVKTDKLKRSVWHIICTTGDKFPSKKVSDSTGACKLDKNVIDFQPKNRHQHLYKYLEKAEIPFLEKDTLSNKTSLDYATERFSVNIFDITSKIFRTPDINLLHCLSGNKLLITYYSLKFGYVNLLQHNFIRSVLATQKLTYYEDDVLFKSFGQKKNCVYIAIKYGQLEVLRYLNTFTNLYDTFDYPPLHVAAEKGDLDIVKELIAHNADVNATDKDERTPLFCVAFQGHLDIVKELIAHTADVNATDKDERTPLFWAAYKGDLDIVKELIAHTADVNARDKDGKTPLFWAAEGGHVDIVKELIARNADVNTTDKDERTPLFCVAFQGHLDIAKELIAHTANVNATDKDGKTPLFWAVEEVHLDIVKELIAYKADVNATDKDGWTPLFWAAEDVHLDIVKELIAHNADVNATDKYEWTPLFWAAEGGHLDIVKELIAHNADVNATDKDERTPFFWAAYKGHLDIVKELMAHTADVNAKDKDGKTPLFWASEGGHLDMVKELIAHNADVNATNKEGWTPLRAAAFQGHLDIVKELIAHNADINATDKDGKTPLFWAVEEVHLDIVKELIAYKADVNATDKDGWTPLFWAAEDVHLDIVKELIAHNADVNATDKYEWTPLFWAAEGGHLDIVKELIAHNADVNATDKDERTPFFWAAYKGHLDIVKELMAHTADVNAKDKDGKTPLFWASEGGHLDMVKELIAHNADVNATNKEGWTPLRAAAFQGHLDIVKELIAHNADINAAYKDEETPLRAAADQDHQNIIEELLAHKADVNATDKYGVTLLRAAAREGLLGIFKEFRKSSENT